MCRRLSVARELQTLDDFIRHLRRVGLVQNALVENRVDCDRLRLIVRFHDGRERAWEITAHELAMDERALRYWIETVDRDIWEHAARYRGPWPEQAATPGLAYGALAQQAASAYNNLYNQQALAQSQSMMAQAQAQRDIYNQIAGVAGAAFQADPLQLANVAALMNAGWGNPIRDPAAEKKAEKLFIESAGKPAFDTLAAGKPLPLTGSSGGKYTLHKRASYCVERIKDRAKLCAVVPGVPLWDHLLGIKLMVENDEPRFLKTANVSGGEPRMGIRDWLAGHNYV